MKRLLSVIIIIAMVLAQLAVVSCGEKNEDTLLTGVFTKTGVDLGDGFIANGSPVLSDGELRVVGMLRDGDDYSPAMAVVNVSDLSAVVDKLPISGTASGFAVGDDGILYIVSRFDNETFKNVYTLECVKDGGVVFSLDADGLLDLGDNYWRDVYAAAGDGRWHAAGNRTLAVITPDGKPESTYELREQVNGMATDRNGVLHVWGMGYHAVLGDRKLENSDVWADAAGYSDLIFGDGHDFYKTNESGIIYGDITDEGVVTGEVMNFVNSSLVVNGNGQFAVADPETVYMYGSDGVGGEKGLWKYTKTEDRRLEDTKLVRMTYIENGRNLVPLAAVKFNQAQNEYYILCDEYFVSNPGCDWQTLMSRLDADIISGNVGETFGTGEMLTLAKNSGDRKLFVDDGRAAVNGQLLTSILDECVDTEGGKCDFTSGAFTDYLEYLASLPENDEGAMYDRANHYASGEIMFYQARIGALSDFAMTMNLFGNKGTDICGYPSSDGGRATLTAVCYYSVVEKSPVKDGAAAFLSYLLSPECTVDELRGMQRIPSLRSTMKAWEETEGMMYYYFFDNNINGWYGDTQPIDESDTGEPGVCVKVDRERFDSFYEYLDGAHVFGYIPQSITDIVSEEMSAFMASAKSADETSEIISNRVSLYLAEKG